MATLDEIEGVFLLAIVTVAVSADVPPHAAKVVFLVNWILSFAPAGVDVFQSVLGLEAVGL